MILSKEEEKIIQPEKREERQEQIYAEPEKKYSKEKVKKRASRAVNIRKTPDGDIVGALSIGKEVEVLEEMNGWAKIGSNKYVKSEFLK